MPTAEGKSSAIHRRIKWMGLLLCLCAGACEQEMQDVIPDVPYFEHVINLESPEFAPLKETHHGVYVNFYGYRPPQADRGHGFFVFRYLEGFTAFDATCPATLECMTSTVRTLTYDGAPKTTVTCQRCGAKFDLVYGGPLNGGRNKLKPYYASRIPGSTISVKITSHKR